MKPGIIRIRDMRFWGRHGANPGERERIQPIDLDVEMHLDCGPAIAGEDLAETIDYATVLRACERIVTQQSFTLLESLADACLAAVLENPRVERATVRVRKPRVLDGATPEIELSRAR
jgi:7,8-dihydroneopterin aldolase/epimerase/oxygenase